MNTPMSEQAKLESYPRRNIQPVQHGANLDFNTAAGASKQQNQTSCSPQDARQRAGDTLLCDCLYGLSKFQIFGLLA